MDGVDVGLGAVVAYLGKDGLQKLLGPTADYLGAGLKEFTAKRVETIGRILRNASMKVGDDLSQNGTVPPKVLHKVLNDGSVCDDFLSVEYMGGVLASARTPEGRDDRAASMAALVDSLSAYQRRAHYLLYSTARKVLRSFGGTLVAPSQVSTQILVPMDGFLEGMDFSENEMARLTSILSHIMFGLSKEGLIKEYWKSGTKDHLSEPGKTEAPCDGLLFFPSAPGAELFLYAFGVGGEEADFLFEGEFDCSSDGVPDGIAGSIRWQPNPR